MSSVFNRRGFLSMAAGMACLMAAPLTTTSALAFDGCGGTVHGLSRTYNLARGTGFLAVRTRPTTRSRMRDQLFNGERVRIMDRSGSWYQISYSRGSGWAHSRWIWNECGW